MLSRPRKQKQRHWTIVIPNPILDVLRNQPRAKEGDNGLVKCLTDYKYMSELFDMSTLALLYKENAHPPSNDVGGHLKLSTDARFFTEFWGLDALDDLEVHYTDTIREGLVSNAPEENVVLYRLPEVVRLGEDGPNDNTDEFGFSLNFTEEIMHVLIIGYNIQDRQENGELARAGGSPRQYELAKKIVVALQHATHYEFDIFHYKNYLIRNTAPLPA